jgi:large subunit ribosomal protein L35
MPKQKTVSSAKKRFKQTGSGGFKHKSQHHQHLLTSKSQKRKRQQRGNKMVSPADHMSVSRMLGLE